MNSHVNTFSMSANEYGRWNSSSSVGLNSRICQPSGADLQRARYRKGTLFELCRNFDTSVLLADGTLNRSDRLARLEAVLLITRDGISAKKLSQLAGLVDGKEAKQLITLLNTSYDATRSAFRIEKTATGYLLMTRPALVTWLDRLHQRQSQMKLSQPSMETLTIIAYQQPITRVGVEAIRGVQSSEMIRQLIDRGLVKVGGEEDSLGRPFLYITTRAFLDMIGIGKIQELPEYDSIGRKPDPPRLAELPEEDQPVAEDELVEDAETQELDDKSDVVTDSDSTDEYEAA